MKTLSVIVLTLAPVCDCRTTLTLTLSVIVLTLAPVYDCTAGTTLTLTLSVIVLTLTFLSLYHRPGEEATEGGGGGVGHGDGAEGPHSSAGRRPAQRQRPFLPLPGRR